MSKQGIRACSSLALSITLALAANEVSAQSAPQPANSPRETGGTTLQEITVTAERFSASVQTTPVAVTALNESLLAERAVTNVLEAMSEIPGITITPVQSSNGTARVYLRGAGQNSGGINYDPAVGIYIDNVYQPRANGAFFDFFDIEQMEVLRGPQGTLYGRNTSGGALKIQTKRPEFYWTGGAQASVGNFDSRAAKGYLSGPLIDGTLAFSVSGVYREREGYLYGTEYGRRVGNVDTRAERLKFLYTPTDNLEVQLSVHAIQDYSESVFGVPLSVHPDVRIPEANGTFDRDLTRTEVFGPLGQANLNSNGGALNIIYDATDSLSLNAITGYGLLRNFSLGNTIWVTPALQAAKDAGGDVNLPSTNEGHLRDEFFTQEFNATYNGERLKGVVGVYYFDEEGSNRASTASSPTIDTDRSTKASAIFAQATYEIGFGVGLTAGVRYTDEDAEYTQYYRQQAAAPQTREENFTATTPKFGINWQVTADFMAYASYTEGFKSGGFSAVPPNTNVGTGNPGEPTPYDPEDVTSYEVGLKYTTPDDRFRINLAAYRAEYDGMQFPTFFVGTSTNYMTNATSGQVEGIEVEPVWQATDTLQLYGNGSFTTGKYTNPWQCASQYGAMMDCSDNEIPGQIPTKTTLGFRYAPEWSLWGSLTFNGSWVYTSAYFNNIANEGPLVQAQESDIFNLTASWVSENGRWNAALDARNLTDEHYIWSGLQLAHPQYPSVTGYVNAPREVFFRVGLNF
jgi:iron complex outermembrane receptor protein